MIIIDEPYISPVLLHFLIETQIPVLQNDFAQKISFDHSSLNILNENDFISLYRSTKNPRLYTTSEYALGWICKTLPEDNLIKQISLLKNKVAFRRTCSCLYEDFFFYEIGFDDLFTFNISEIQLPVVLKPSIGFLSTGVYIINNYNDWQRALIDIKQHFVVLAATFPSNVVGDNWFIIESYIKGREFAIDLYFNEQEPVIVNIFEHPFISETDVRDRLYYSNQELFETYRTLFTEHIIQLNQVLGLCNIPIHMEIRVYGNKIIPIEINPLRFAGLCLNEIHLHINGKHPLYYYFSKTYPDYNQMWKGKEQKTFCFSIFEKHKKGNITIDTIKQLFSNILEIRPVSNPNLNVFAFVFSEINSADKTEINKILNFDINNYQNIQSVKLPV